MFVHNNNNQKILFLFGRQLLRLAVHLTVYFAQKRKTTTISVEVKKSQHKYIIGPKGNTLQEILETTGVSVEMPQLDSGSETIILRGEPDKLGPALTQVYAKVRLALGCTATTLFILF